MYGGLGNLDLKGEVRLELEKFWDAFCTFEGNLWDEWGCKEGQEIWIQEEKQGWS